MKWYNGGKGTTLYYFLLPAYFREGRSRFAFSSRELQEREEKKAWQM